jgi:hypothetical protein
MPKTFERFEKLVTQVQAGRQELLTDVDMAFEKVVRYGTEDELKKSMEIMENFLISNLCDIKEDVSESQKTTNKKKAG